MDRRGFIRGLAAVAAGGIVMPTRRIWQVGASLHSSASLVSPHDLEKKWARLIDQEHPKGHPGDGGRRGRGGWSGRATPLKPRDYCVGPGPQLYSPEGDPVCVSQGVYYAVLRIEDREKKR